jgi:hypothetical protein
MQATSKCKGCNKILFLVFGYRFRGGWFYKAPSLVSIFVFLVIEIEVNTIIWLK